MELIVASALWRRLDVPGHDSCSLGTIPQGWELQGTAVFLHEGEPARLSYQVRCDPAWRTLGGAVAGVVGKRPIALAVLRGPGGAWLLNGATVPGLEHCLDLDFGFTPATNLLQLRRVDLAEGQAADVPVAWLDVESGGLRLLSQRYERRSPTTYWYEAPRFDYAALLEVDSAGFATRYPGLWEAENLRSDITSENRHPEIDTGDAQGKEAW